MVKAMSDLAASRRIYTQVAERLMQMIATELAPGSYLPPERILAQQLNVSRSSIREGIIALEVLGAVEVRVGAGVMVLDQSGPRPITLPQAPPLLDPELGAELAVTAEIPPFAILEARRLIEPECAAAACRKGSDAQLAAIASAYERNVQDNLEGSRTHPGDRLFHIRIAEASGNAAFHMLMVQMIGAGYGPVFQRLQTLYTTDDMPTRSQDEHKAILNAILDRKAESARMAMRNHLDNVIEIFSR